MKSQSVSVIFSGSMRVKPRGIIDQAVDVSEVFFNIGKEALDLGDVFKVGSKHGCVAAFGGGSAGRILRTAVMNGDAGA